MKKKFPFMGKESAKEEKAEKGMKKGGCTKMAKGGVTRADGCISHGGTRGKMK